MGVAYRTSFENPGSRLGKGELVSVGEFTV